MCGIAGIVNKNAGATVDRSLLERMTSSMAHRGPEAEGFFLRGPVGLGHRRLKIIDLEGGRQPLYNEDDSVVVVYNGEIYNFQELKADLEKRGHRFRTHCDTEVIVHAYEEYGEECPKFFRGMFAFAIHDTRSGRVFLARDRVGIKPLYYRVDDERILFASEVKAILACLDERPTVNAGMLDFYVSLGYVPGEESLFAGIRKLLPGHSLTIEKGVPRGRRYWDLQDVPPTEISFAEAAGRFEALLTDCVRMRLMSEVPLGAFLSGGLDSSAVVALMSRLMNEPVKTFSVGYDDDPASSELQYARRVANAFKTDHHEFVLNSGDFFDSIDTLLEHAEEPIVEGAAVALYRLSRLAKEHVTVILSGEGGDEILSGYPLHQIMRKVDRLRGVLAWLPAPLRGAVVAPLRRTEKGRKYADWLGQPLRERYWSISSDVTGSIRQAMYRDDFRRTMDGRVAQYFLGLFDAMSRGTDLRRMTYADIKSWLAEDLLLKADKMTMACSLELRVPFLDYQLMEFATALPDDYRLKGTQGKFLLKKVMEKYLPREIIYRKKRGFPVPMALWFRDKLHGRLKEILLDDRTTSRGYFNKPYIERILESHRSGREDLSRRLFSLLTLEMWHRKYID